VAVICESVLDEMKEKDGWGVGFRCMLGGNLFSGESETCSL